MNRARKKAPAQQAAQSLEQATDLLARYVEILDTVDELKLAAQIMIDGILAERDQTLTPLESEAKAIFRQLRPWWSANCAQLTDGKRKSLEIAGAQIGDRITPPALGLPPKMKLADFLEWLLLMEAEDLVRTKHTIDRQACIKALRALDLAGVEDVSSAPDFDAQCTLGRMLKQKGAAITQKEEFFIDRAGKKENAPEEVEIEQEGYGA